MLLQVTTNDYRNYYYYWPTISINMMWKKGCSFWLALVLYLYNVFGHQSQSYSIVFETVLEKRRPFNGLVSRSIIQDRFVLSTFSSFISKKKYLFSWIQGSFSKNDFVCCFPCLRYHIDTEIYSLHCTKIQT